MLRNKYINTGTVTTGAVIVVMFNIQWRAFIRKRALTVRRPLN